MKVGWGSAYSPRSQPSTIIGSLNCCPLTLLGKGTERELRHDRYQFLHLKVIDTCSHVLTATPKSVLATSIDKVIPLFPRPFPAFPKPLGWHDSPFPGLPQTRFRTRVPLSCSLCVLVLHRVLNAGLWAYLSPEDLSQEEASKGQGLSGSLSICLLSPEISVSRLHCTEAV